MRISYTNQQTDHSRARLYAQAGEMAGDLALIGADVYCPDKLPTSYNLAGGAAILHGACAVGHLFYAGMDDGLTAKDQRVVLLRAAAEGLRSGGWALSASGSVMHGSGLVALAMVGDALTNLLPTDTANI